MTEDQLHVWHFNMYDIVKDKNQKSKKTDFTQAIAVWRGFQVKFVSESGFHLVFIGRNRRVRDGGHTIGICSQGKCENLSQMNGKYFSLCLARV